MAGTNRDEMNGDVTTSALQGTCVPQKVERLLPHHWGCVKYSVVFYFYFILFYFIYFLLFFLL